MRYRYTETDRQLHRHRGFTQLLWDTQWKTIITFTFQFRITYKDNPPSIFPFPFLDSSIFPLFFFCIVIVNHLSANLPICIANFPNYQKESKGIRGWGRGRGKREKTNMPEMSLFVSVWSGLSVVPGELFMGIAYWIWQRLNWKFIKTYVKGLGMERDLRGS